jgi:hypothetical protein
MLPSKSPDGLEDGGVDAMLTDDWLDWELSEEQADTVSRMGTATLLGTLADWSYCSLLEVAQWPEGSNRTSQNVMDFFRSSKRDAEVA